MTDPEERDAGMDLFATPAEREPGLLTADDLVDQPQLDGGGVPRGLLADGFVRTTGWLQFGAHPIGTGVVTAIIGLLVGVLVAIAIWSVGPAVSALAVLLFPGAGYGAWWLLSRFRPASVARDLDVVPVTDLRTNDWIRAYGSIGPVAQVASVAPAADGAAVIRFFGGTTVTWPLDRRVRRVELSEVDTQARPRGQS
ncbi:MAG TPA: hypothetical protein VG247_29810 [Pseudonocardiaceae bacterium]|nr:hypothetical protein [Pseudonocardiaceae bacterium]